MASLVLELEDVPYSEVFSKIIGYVDENRASFRMIFSPNGTNKMRFRLGTLLEGTAFLHSLVILLIDPLNRCMPFLFLRNPSLLQLRVDRPVVLSFLNKPIKSVHCDLLN